MRMRVGLFIALLLAGMQTSCSDEANSGSTTDCTGSECSDDRGRRRPGNDVSGDATTGGDSVGNDCEDAEIQCSLGGIPQMCVSGVFVDQEQCSDNEVCVGGRCIVQDNCTPGEVFGCSDDVSQRVCNTAGDGFEARPCVDGPFCFQGECGDQICEPERRRCGVAPQDVEECDGDGENWGPTTPCDAEAEEVCFEGECVTGCLASLKEPTYIGCAYWSIDLPQFEDPFGDPRVIPHAVVVANAGDREAEVTVESGSGITIPQPLTVVPANEIRTITFPRLDVEGTTRTNRSFHITSTEPVIAYQFNPLNDVGVASNDASLLLPESALGREYYVTTWPSGVAFLGLPPQTSWFTVVGSSDGLAEVTITFSTDLVDGPDAELNGVTAGETRVFDVLPGEVLNFEAESEIFPLPGNIRDLTGTHIVSTNRIAVFAGHEEAVIGEAGDGDSACCADHLEEQLFPVSTWGTNYVAVHSPPRGNEVDIWRVIAAQNNTRITTNPMISGLHGRTLQQGEWYEAQTTESFEIVASDKIQVTQFIVSQEDAGITDTIGDPAMVLAVPVEQWRDDYRLLTPQNYSRDYVTVIRRAGEAVRIEDVEITASFTPIGAGTFEFTHIQWEPGPHHVDGDGTFGVAMFGYDTAVSYGYPGGLNLNSD